MPIRVEFSALNHRISTLLTIHDKELVKYSTFLVNFISTFIKVIEVTQSLDRRPESC